MTTIARTNLCTNPESNGTSTAGWTPLRVTLSATAGTITGTSQQYFRATVTDVTAGAYTQRADFTTAAASMTAGKTYQFSLWLRNTGSPRTTSVTAFFFNSSGTQIGTSNTVGSEVGPGFTQLSWTGVAPAGTDHALLRIGVNSDQANWVVNDFFDFGAVYIGEPGTYFDGSTAAVNNLAYQWTGTANASTSQEYYALPTILTVAKTDAPCPRTEVTVVGLGTGTTVFNVWRTSDGKRKAVRGARLRSGVDSDFVVDYEAPLNRVLTYDIEVISGTQVTQPTYPATVTVLSSTWWIQDPLVPSSAIPLNVSKQDSNAPYLTGNAIKSLDYGASVTLIPILGSTDPVALMGNRTIAGNVTFDMFTNLASVTTQLRNLIQQTPLLLIRSTGTRNNGIPGLAYFTSAKPSEKPVTVAFGGTLTNWALTGDLVAAPTMNVLVPIWTYGTVAALWTTYQQAQTTLAGKTYLDVLKSPSGV